VTSTQPDPWGWVAAEDPPDHYRPTWVAPGSYLIPMRSGAVLRWVYDEDGDDTYSLLVRLTEDEAQRVFESDRRSGMLESVRPSLRWPGALLIVSDDRGAPHRSWRYTIQSDTSEEEFIRDLMSPPASVVREAVLTAQQRRDAEFAAPLLAFALAS
jgi:hypothetical protein